MTIPDAKSIYFTALQNTRALEKQGLEQMERQLSGLESYPEYRLVLQKHVATTKTQLARLDRALAEAGQTASGLKETITSIAGSIGAAVHAVAQDETLKNLYAGYAFQYDQIAAYRSLIVIAEAAGQTAHIADFRLSIEEEKQAAGAVDALIESITRTYIDRTLQGAKADS